MTGPERTSHDRLIRTALHRSLREWSPGIRIVDEIETGVSRIDVATITPARIVGYEIKSDRDSCLRLEQQCLDYSFVCDRAAVVCGPRHVNKVEEIAPEWWGIFVAEGDPVELRTVREMEPNPRVDLARTLTLLWNPELRTLVEKYKIARGVRRKPRREMVERLCSHGPVDRLRFDALQILLERHTWRKVAA